MRPSGKTPPVNIALLIAFGAMFLNIGISLFLCMPNLLTAKALERLHAFQEREDAWKAARRYVGNRVGPRSGKRMSDRNDPSVTITRIAAGRYRVTGSLEYRKVAGQPLHQDWACTATEDGEGRWIVSNYLTRPVRPADATR